MTSHLVCEILFSSFVFFIYSVKQTPTRTIHVNGMKILVQSIGERPGSFTSEHFTCCAMVEMYQKNYNVTKSCCSKVLWLKFLEVKSFEKPLKASVDCN